jgi:hypothetical protein
MTVGDLNKKFGWLWIILGPTFGMIITFQFQKVEGYAYFLEGGAGVADTFQRMGNRLVHAHTGLLSFLSILYGYGIDEVPLGEGVKKLGSYLTVVGVILVSISFFAIIAPVLGTIGGPSRTLGFLAILIAILILASGQLKK